MPLTPEEQIELEYLESLARWNYIYNVKPLATKELLSNLDEDSAIRYQELMLKILGE